MQERVGFRFVSNTDTHKGTGVLIMKAPKTKTSVYGLITRLAQASDSS